MSATKAVRLLPFDQFGGSRQLAVAEAVIEAVGRGVAPATLRLYSWSGASLILGVGQSSDAFDLAACEANGVRILRRISGGTAVLHRDDTISFQLVLPASDPLVTDDIHVNYRLFADLIVDVLASLGIGASVTPLAVARADRPPEGLEAICFSSLAPYEITAQGRKLVGLAQVRRTTVTALQGMIYRAFDATKSVQLLRPGALTQDKLASSLGSRTTDLASAAGRAVEAPEIFAAFQHAVVSGINRALKPEQLTPWEIARADELQQSKYDLPAWTFRR